MPPCTCMARSAASQHSRLAQKLHIETLSDSQRSTERLAFARVFHAFIDAVYGGAQRTRRLPDPVLMHKTLRQRQPAADLAEQRIVRHEHVSKTDTRMIGRHIEGPHILLDLHAFAL